MCLISATLLLSLFYSHLDRPFYVNTGGLRHGDLQLLFAENTKSAPLCRFNRFDEYSGDFACGLSYFPGCFSFGMQPNEGPTLLFTVLPAVFDQLPFGTLFFIGFLVAFLFAALTSAFSMVEIIVATIGKGDESKRKNCPGRADY